MALVCGTEPATAPSVPGESRKPSKNIDTIFSKFGSGSNISSEQFPCLMQICDNNPADISFHGWRVMIIALAGRRIDTPNAGIRRFPPENLELVRTRIRSVLQAKSVAVLISSAACGADLIALEEAGAMGLRCRIVLPFDAQRFRVTSVTDRPGNWGEIYDRLIRDVQGKGDLLILDGAEGNEAYSAANRAILDEAERLAKDASDEAVAMVVWDGVPRGDQDYTQAFADEARRRRLPLLEVKTV
jgi:hypothetical protein